MTNLLRHLAVCHAGYLVASALVLCGFEFLLCAIVASVDVGGAVRAVMESLPPLLQAAIGEQMLGGMSARGMLAFGWNHPIAHAVGTAVAIVLATRAVAGEVESGAIELVMAQPLARVGYLGAHVAFALTALAVLSLAGVAGTIAGQTVFHLERFAPAALARLALGYFLLQGAWFAFTLALSAFAREGGWVALSAFLAALVSYLIQVIGRMWPAAEFLMPYSLHDYYAPQAILVRGELAARSVAVLLAALAVGTGVAVWRFLRRDLP